MEVSASYISILQMICPKYEVLGFEGLPLKQSLVIPHLQVHLGALKCHSYCLPLQINRGDPEARSANDRK